LALQALSFFMPGDSGRQIVDHADELYEQALRSGASRGTADARYCSFVKGNALGILAEVARAFAYGYWGFVYAYMVALALLAGIMSFMKFLVHARLLYADTLGQVIAIVLIALIFVGSGVVAGAVSSAHARQTASAGNGARNLNR
jgi:hypothetical protein